MPPLRALGLKGQALAVLGTDLHSYDAIFWSVGIIGCPVDGFCHREGLLVGDPLPLLAPTPESSDVVCWACSCMVEGTSVGTYVPTATPHPSFV